MAKYKLRIEAREMRRKGESVKEIANILGVSKGTVSIWVRDIILSVEQMEALKQRSLKGGELGRLKGSLMQKERRLKMMRNMDRKGFKRFSNLSEEEFFAAGIGLYWGEGSKKKREFYICNSDPDLIKFMIIWLRKFYGVTTERLALVVGINGVHRKREGVVKNYWSNKLGIPLSQFRKTSFKKSKLNKVYENFNEHYGTLGVRVLKGSEIYYKILGLISGLTKASKRYNNLSQDSSVG
jgi:transcriptional regulator with XRE-family HTH domain